MHKCEEHLPKGTLTLIKAKDHEISIRISMLPTLGIQPLSCPVTLALSRKDALLVAAANEVQRCVAG